MGFTSAVSTHSEIAPQLTSSVFDIIFSNRRKPFFSHSLHVDVISTNTPESLLAITTPFLSPGSCYFINVYVVVYLFIVLFFTRVFYFILKIT